MTRRGKSVEIEVDVNTTAYVDIDPEDHPELVEWAENRGNAPPSLAMDTIERVAQHLKDLCWFPARDAFDRSELDAIADDLRDVWDRITRQATERTTP